MKINNNNSCKNHKFYNSCKKLFYKTIPKIWTIIIIISISLYLTKIYLKFQLYHLIIIQILQKTITNIKKKL